VRLDVQQNDDGRHTDAWAMSTDSKTRAWKLRAWVELRIMLHQLIQDGTTGRAIKFDETHIRQAIMLVAIYSIGLSDPCLDQERVLLYHQASHE
jgi:hypothetical protein